MSVFSYIGIVFTKGLGCSAYQEINAAQQVVRYCDLDGDTLDVPDVTESNVIDADPPFPPWGT